jgi:predicted nucleic acid-binding protein
MSNAAEAVLLLRGRHRRVERLRIYLDTSVIGGCLDVEFATDSQRVIDAVKAGRVVMLLSELVLGELVNAPPPVQEILKSLPNESIEIVDLTEDINQLRDAYIGAGVVGQKSQGDAAHVAAATVARADAIVSWNFKHIVRLDKMKAYNQVNLLNGYGILTIVSPLEVILDEPESS